MRFPFDPLRVRLYLRATILIGFPAARVTVERMRTDTKVLLSMLHGEYCMTLVQAQIPDGEYRLLRQRAANRGEPMKEIVRQAIHAYLQDEKVDPNDPLFRAFPLGASGRKGHDVARRHDEILYGPRRR